MALPRIKDPVFTDILPVSGKEFKYRPFASKEQTNVLLAAQGGDARTVIMNLIELVDNCTFNKLDVEKMTIPDFDKVWLAIRSKSVGETIELSYTCDAPIIKNGEEKVCRHKNTFEVPYMDLVKYSEPGTGLFDVDDTIKICLDPLYVSDILVDGVIEDDAMPAHINDVKFLYDKTSFVLDGEETYTEFTIEEFAEFVEKFPPRTVEEIIDYYSNMQSVMTIPTKCRGCGATGEVVLTGSMNFFG